MTATSCSAWPTEIQLLSPMFILASRPWALSTFPADPTAYRMFKWKCLKKNPSYPPAFLALVYFQFQFWSVFYMCRSPKTTGDPHEAKQQRPHVAKYFLLTLTWKVFVTDEQRKYFQPFPILKTLPLKAFCSIRCFCLNPRGPRHHPALRTSQTKDLALLETI